MNKITLRHILLLTRDEESPPIRKIEQDDAIGILKEDKFKIVLGGVPPEK